MTEDPVFSEEFLREQEKRLAPIHAQRAELREHSDRLHHHQAREKELETKIREVSEAVAEGKRPIEDLDEPTAKLTAVTAAVEAGSRRLTTLRNRMAGERATRQAVVEAAAPLLANWAEGWAKEGLARFNRELDAVLSDVLGRLGISRGELTAEVAAIAGIGSGLGNARSYSPPGTHVVLPDGTRVAPNSPAAQEHSERVLEEARENPPTPPDYRVGII